MVKVQVEVPLQLPPVQPVKVEPASAVAVSVTDVPLAKPAAQVAPQLMPEGEEETVPVPVPVLETVSVTEGAVLKVAVAASDADTVRLQDEVPVQAPLQPAKMEPASAVAVSVTEAPLAKLPEQAVPQLIPEGEEVTVPVP